MSLPIKLDFQTISSWDQVIPFAGRVVAYKTDSYYFGAEAGDNQGDTHFGYIEEGAHSWGGDETGFSMNKLLKPSDVGRTCALTATHLNKPISMRLATTEEVEFIGNAIRGGQAKFEMMWKEKIPAILERSLHPEAYKIDSEQKPHQPFGISCDACEEPLGAPIIGLPECSHALHPACYEKAMENGHVCPSCHQKFTKGESCPALEELIAKIDRLNVIIRAVPGSHTIAQLFTLAIEKGELNVVAKLPKNMIHELVDGITPLYRACKSGHIEIVQYLLQQGADPTQKNDLSYGGNYDKYWSVNDMDHLHGASPIRPAVQSGNAELVRLLIENCAHVDERGPLGRTPLFEAVRAGQEELALWFIDLGADISTKDDYGCPLIIEAAPQGLFKVMLKLLEKGANINDESEWGTALECVAKCDDPAILQFLLEHGAKEVINKRWLDTWTPISRAVSERKVENVKLLVQAGADLSIRYEGLNLLELAKKELRETMDYYCPRPESMEREGKRLIEERQAVVDYLTPLFSDSGPASTPKDEMMPPPAQLITFSDGSVVPHALVAQTLTHIQLAMKVAGPVGAPSLLRDLKKIAIHQDGCTIRPNPFCDSLALLKAHFLVDGNGHMIDWVKSVVKNVVIGEGLEIKLQSPTIFPH